MPKPTFIPLTGFKTLTSNQSLKQSKAFYQQVKKRRTVRSFSKKKVSKEIINKCILAAGTAPNGANKQPWHFVVISDPVIKRKLRMAAEEEEREFYRTRATKKWLEDLEALGTDAKKPFLEDAPYLIVVFSQMFEIDSKGNKNKNYYVTESVGIASGILITALHNAGLATLTHTPSPMQFLNKVLKRPKNEKPMMIVVTGHPAKGTLVPNITKKKLEEITSYY